VHPSEMVSEIVLSSEAVASLSITSILGAINCGPFPMNVLNMAREGSEGIATKFTSSPTGSSRGFLPMDQY